jgi:hypothetical protein
MLKREVPKFLQNTYKDGKTNLSHIGFNLRLPIYLLLFQKVTTRSEKKSPKKFCIYSSSYHLGWINSKYPMLQGNA